MEPQARDRRASENARAAAAARAEESGSLLPDAMITVAVLTVGILGVLFAFQPNFCAIRDTAANDQTHAALEDALETLQSEPLAGVQAKYQGALLPADSVVGPNGYAASVAVQFDVDETKIPAEFGPVADIDGDGQLRTANASASYQLLPARLTISYQMSYGVESRMLYFILGSQ